MAIYVWALLRAAFAHGLLWWSSLILTWLFSVGLFSANEYAAVRDKISSWLGLPIMPETMPLWLIAGLFFVWVVARLAHREAMTYLHAGRIIFEPPFVDRGVPLFEIPRGGARRLIGRNDIAKIVARNSPYDGARGNVIQECYASIEFFHQQPRQPALQFDYPRWQNNPKPGHQHDDPVPHVRDEWNRRMLPSTGEAHTLNFLVKSIEDDCAFGFRARSQLEPMWHDQRLKLQPGNYVAKLTVSGVGLRRPAEQWLCVRVGGAGQSIEVERSLPVDTRRWF